VSLSGLLPHYHAMLVQSDSKSSVCLSVTFRYHDHIGWNTSKVISPPNSNKIVMWRFLRNRRLILCLHTIFRAHIYWAHCPVILAIAWLLVLLFVTVHVSHCTLLRCIILYTNWYVIPCTECVQPVAAANVKVYGPAVEAPVRPHAVTYLVVDCKEAGPGLSLCMSVCLSVCHCAECLV